MRALRRSLGAPLLAALPLRGRAARGDGLRHRQRGLAAGRRCSGYAHDLRAPGDGPLGRRSPSPKPSRPARPCGSRDLARTLPPAVQATPYRWAFGDGGTRLGYAVVHRYRRAGTYRLTVSGYDRGARRWFAFDQAVLRVVPADQVVGANLEYDALQGVIALSGVTGPVDGVIVALVLVLLVRRTRGQGPGALDEDGRGEA